MAVSAIAVGYYLQIVERSKKDWHYITLVALTVFIGYSHAYRPKSNPVRVLLSVGQFAGIIFYTLFTSVLVRRVTVLHYKPQIDSIEEITLAGDFTLAGDRFALQKIFQQNEVPSIQIWNFKTN